MHDHGCVSRSEAFAANFHVAVLRRSNLDDGLPPRGELAHRGVARHGGQHRPHSASCRARCDTDHHSNGDAYFAVTNGNSHADPYQVPNAHMDT